MQPWQEDCTYWYLGRDGVLVEASSLGNVPEEIEDYAKIWDAVKFFPELSLRGKSAHVVDTVYHALCLQVLQIAVNRYGEKMTIFRGTAGSWPLEQHKILYGATDPSVASSYGSIVKKMDVIGLRTVSPTSSVLSKDDPYSEDEEIIFFPDTVLKCY